MEKELKKINDVSKKNVFFLLMMGFLALGLFIIFLPLISNADPLDNRRWRNPLSKGYYLNGVAYGNNTFVAVGPGGTILTSPDGITWTEGSSGTSKTLYGVTYGNNTFVAVGSTGTIATSPDSLPDIFWVKEDPNLLLRLDSSEYHIIFLKKLLHL